MELVPPGIIPPDDDPVMGRDPIVDKVESALEQGREEEALAIAEAALEKGEGNRLDLLFLVGDALLSLGRAAKAEQSLRKVLQEDSTCAISRCWLAMALYRQCRFDEAQVECDLALAADRPATDAHVVQGLLLERSGDLVRAEVSFVHAAELDPKKFHAPVRLSRADFDREVRKAAKQLPRQFRTQLELLPVIVQELPALTLLQAQSPPLDPDLLGLFEGVPLTMTGELDGVPHRPNSIYLFQRNLERLARDRGELVAEIANTLYHELGHYLGFEEEDMENLGLE